MNSFFQTLAFTYLLYPILGLLLVGLGIFIAKKNALLNNKRLVGYSIGAIAILRLPVLLGFLDYGFMPINYIALMVDILNSWSVQYPADGLGLFCSYAVQSKCKYMNGIQMKIRSFILVRM